jgi:hypothetical protein
MESEILDRTPPHSLDAERSVIGSILLDPARLDEVRETLHAEDFHGDVHRRIFTHFLAMRNGGAGAIDTTLLLDRLAHCNDLAAMGGGDGAAATIAECLHSVPYANHASFYAKIVRDKAEARRLIHVSTELLRDAYNNTAPATLRARLQTALERIDVGPTVARFPLLSSAALDSADCTARPIVTEALFAGSPAVIGGMFKTGKTLLGIDAAISIATGRMFLGAYTVPEPRGVVYFTGEGGPAVAQEYGRRIAAAKGIALADVTGLHWCFSVPRLEDLDDLDAFAKVLDDTASEVAILDNLMLCLSGDNAGNVYSMGGVLGNAVRICSERNVTPIFVHHFKRTRATADPYAPGELGDLTQAGVAEIAGQWLLLTRREAYDPDEPGTHRLWLSIGGRMGHSSLHALDVQEGSRADPEGRRWEVTLTPASEARAVALADKENRKATDLERREGEQRDRLLTALRTMPAGDTSRQLRIAGRLNPEGFDRAIFALVQEGRATRCKISKNGTNYDGYKPTGR